MAKQITENIVFDCDGTLVDSEEIHAKALQGALAELGVRLTIPEIRSQSAGIANSDYLSRVADERGFVLPPDAARRVEDISERLIAHQIRLMDGADRVVRTLAANGVRLAVASNSSHRLVEQMLHAVRLAPIFGDRIAARDDVALAKPAPDVYRRAMQLLDARSEDCLAIEDSPVGITAAHAAGIEVIGFLPPASIFAEAHLIEAGASTVIKNLVKILG
jgi:HAD superfamily hydrolase (TIGR01509 family)